LLTGRSKAQREAALERGDELTAEELDRDPELKLGPAANSMERRAKAMAEREGREYPSSVWRRHFGTGAHTSRARVHTELGRLGPEGVEVAQRRRGQDMVDGLLAENLGA